MDTSSSTDFIQGLNDSFNGRLIRRPLADYRRGYRLGVMLLASIRRRQAKESEHKLCQSN